MAMVMARMMTNMVMTRMMTQMVHKLVMVIASMMTNMVYKLVMVITTMVTLMMLLLKRNLMVEKSSKTGGVSFTSSTVRRI